MLREIGPGLLTFVTRPFFQPLRTARVQRAAQLRGQGIVKRFAHQHVLEAQRAGRNLFDQSGVRCRLQRSLDTLHRQLRKLR